MAVQVHACLTGNWVNLNDDPECKMGVHRTSPYIWWEENAEIYSPLKKDEADTMYKQDYVNIYHKGVEYRIHPMFIQIVTV